MREREPTVGVLVVAAVAGSVSALIEICVPNLTLLLLYTPTHRHSVVCKAS